MKTNPKVKFFIWRACQNALPTKENLWKRKISPDPLCDLCRATVETAEHTLLLCPWVAGVWNHMETNQQTEAHEIRRLDEWLTKFTSKDPHLPSLETVGTLLWQVWKGRNDFIFRGTKPEANKVIDLARSQQISYQKWGSGEERLVECLWLERIQEEIPH
jgi:hypothetical protein